MQLGEAIGPITRSGWDGLKAILDEAIGPRDVIAAHLPIFSDDDAVALAVSEGFLVRAEVAILSETQYSVQVEWFPLSQLHRVWVSEAVDVSRAETVRETTASVQVHESEFKVAHNSRSYESRDAARNSFVEFIAALTGQSPPGSQVPLIQYGSGH